LRAATTEKLRRFHSVLLLGLTVSCSSVYIACSGSEATEQIPDQGAGGGDGTDAAADQNLFPFDAQTDSKKDAAGDATGDHLGDATGDHLGNDATSEQSGNDATSEQSGNDATSEQADDAADDSSDAPTSNAGDSAAD
jgi:hypothetical protein